MIPSKKYICILLCFIFSFYVKAQSCTCYDFIYLNDTGGPDNKVEKFKVNPIDGSLTEIGSPWLLANGIVDQPHGIAADLNGFLYIGERDTENGEYNIQKFNCNAEKVDGDLSTIAIDNFTDDGYSYNHFSIGNYLYTNIFYDEFNGFNEVRIYDLCTGNLIGCQAPASLWGLSAGTDGYWYGTGWTPIDNQGNWGPGIVKGSLDPATFTDGNGGCGVLESFMTADALNIPSGSQAQGITQDADGSIYISVSAGGGFAPPSYVMKIRPDGTTITSLTDYTTESNTTDNLNWAGARGLVWSQGANMLYVSTGDDCLAAFDTSLNYIPEASVHPPGIFPKQVGIITECCPSPANLTIDTFFCNLNYPIDIPLQDLINCNGIACEGTWTFSDTNIDINYNDCSNSITLNGDKACGSFNLFSEGSNALAQCGQFSITVNIESASIVAATITDNQTLCPIDTPADLVATSPTPDVTYQWQMSTTGCSNFTNIAGATTDTYSPAAISETTYYRVVTSIVGGCAAGNCNETSNCITLELGTDCCTEIQCLSVTIDK